MPKITLHHHDNGNHEDYISEDGLHVFMRLSKENNYKWGYFQASKLVDKDTHRYDLAERNDIQLVHRDED